jgi:hypothetical protein
MFQTEPLSYDIAYQTQSNTLPPSALGYHTNNKYEGFPPLMSDGRTVTASFQPEAVLNEHLLRETGVETNWQYRQYLTKNAKEIMKYNCVQTATDAGYLKRYADLNQGETHSTPYLFPTYESKNRPKGYQDSDLKELYLTRDQLQARMIAPEITQSELYNKKVSR